MIRTLAFACGVLSIAAACGSTGGRDAVPSGRALYLAHCASCHGTTGRGDGPLAATLSRPPADLTQRPDLDEPVSVAQVMAQAHGYYRRDAPDEVMPVFADILDGPTVLYDIGDGIATPTPLPLVKVAEYVRSLQVRDGGPGGRGQGTRAATDPSGGR